MWGYSSFKSCLEDLERNDKLVRISTPVSANLDLAEIQRRAYARSAPALLFENVEGTPFPVASNVFGTLERSRFIFRHTLDVVKLAVKMKADPGLFLATMAQKGWRHPHHYLKLPLTGLRSVPQRRPQSWSPVMQNETTLDKLPQVKSWPKDGGAFITLPQVFSYDVSRPSLLKSNLGMYRVQISGNDYEPNREVGVHYQIHRGMGVHHDIALRENCELPVSIFVGGPPAHTLSAVMPLPEGLSELVFAGMLSDRAFRYARYKDYYVSADADFCILGRMTMETKTEGPFGDHLGYYSLEHPFPVLKVDKVFHRSDAVWPMTVVGRPPQEDTTFGELIHEIASPMVPTELPGVKALHAVDAAGVHPLLLAVGSERYVPYDKGVPREILTQAHQILGFNQCSLAKYLFIAEDAAGLDVEHIRQFLCHCLERVDWQRDLHFHTRTTMDTLDYSSLGLNEGSKLVVAVAGSSKRSLCKELPSDLPSISGFESPHLAMPGVIMIKGPQFQNYKTAAIELDIFCKAYEKKGIDEVALLVVCDEPDFSAKTMNNFLWTTFTRSNPSHDIYGVQSDVVYKHWGCKGPLVIDARLKPHMAPPLVEDPASVKRVDDFIQADATLKKYLF